MKTIKERVLELNEPRPLVGREGEVIGQIQNSPQTQEAISDSFNQLTQDLREAVESEDFYGWNTQTQKMIKDKVLKLLESLSVDNPTPDTKESV